MPASLYNCETIADWTKHGAVAVTTPHSSSQLRISTGDRLASRPTERVRCFPQLVRLSLQTVCDQLSTSHITDLCSWYSVVNNHHMNMHANVKTVRKFKTIISKDSSFYDKYSNRESLTRTRRLTAELMCYKGWYALFLSMQLDVSDCIKDVKIWFMFYIIIQFNPLQPSRCYDPSA